MRRGREDHVVLLGESDWHKPDALHWVRQQPVERRYGWIRRQICTRRFVSSELQLGFMGEVG